MDWYKRCVAIDWECDESFNRHMVRARYVLIHSIRVELRTNCLLTNLIGVFCSVVFNFPVSLVVPFFFSSCLLCNILVVGLLQEPFTKIMRVGTYVIVVSVILLPSVGPQLQDGQTLTTILQPWYTVVWFVGLCSAALVTALVLVLTDLAQYPTPFFRYGILFTARASSLCVNLTVSRLLVLDPPSRMWVIFLVGTKLITGAIYTYAIVIQSMAGVVEQATFVPINATLIIVLNALTGCIIWEDWKTISSWSGYVCVFALLGLGCELLLSGTPQLTNENAIFGLAASLRPASPADFAAASSSLNDDNYYFDDDDDSITNNDHDDDDNDDDDDDDDEVVVPNDIFAGFEMSMNSNNDNDDHHQQQQRIYDTPAAVVTLSTREAWKEVVSPVKSTSKLYASFRSPLPQRRRRRRRRQQQQQQRCVMSTTGRLDNNNNNNTTPNYDGNTSMGVNPEYGTIQ